MIASDSNILVYAIREDSPWHRRAQACIRKLAEGAVSAICRAGGVTEIWTADRDYSRFPGLLVRNLLLQ